MKKLLILLLFLAVVIGGAMFWLGGKAENGRPADGEVRIEVDNPL